MFRTLFAVVVLNISLGSTLHAQSFGKQANSDVCATARARGLTCVTGSEAILRIQQNSVLTFNGKPFRAVMEINEEKGDPLYKGHVEVLWIDPNKYRVELHSNDFDQVRIVNGAQVQETDHGDFYPGWLHGFVNALLDPMPRKTDFANNSQPVIIAPNIHRCFSRDDRPGGITDQMTWGQLCFGEEGPHLDFVIDFTYNMEFHDYRPFGDKEIAHTYVSGEGDHARIDGKLVTLEELQHPDETLFNVVTPTPLSQQIHTTFVSTFTEESMVESKPSDTVWPPTHEAKLDGYMIVQAITDRTGQVRETSKHNSDNAELERFGRVLALKYKFHPLLVDGVPQQMEMPLVLHFSSKKAAPYPEFDDAEIRKRALDCKVPTTVRDIIRTGPTEIDILVGEDGRVDEIHEVPNKYFSGAFSDQLKKCAFEPLVQDGDPTRYIAHLRAQAVP